MMCFLTRLIELVQCDDFKISLICYVDDNVLIADRNSKSNFSETEKGNKGLENDIRKGKKATM